MISPDASESDALKNEPPVSSEDATDEGIASISNSQKGRKPFQLTLPDMLWITAFVSVIAAMVGYVGVQSFQFWICLAGSLTLTWLFTERILCRKNMGTGCLLALLFFISVFLFTSAALILNSMLHWGIYNYLNTKKHAPSPRFVIAASLISLLFSFGVGICIGYPGYLELSRNRDKTHPVEIDSRLAYENDSPKLPFVANAEEWYAFDDLLREKVGRFHSRQYALRSLHDSQVESFVKSSGFGVSRMFFLLYPRYVDDAREIATIPFYGEWKREMDFLQDFQFVPGVNVWDDVEPLHFNAISDFFHPESLGVEIEPKRRIGFLPHAFHNQPKELASAGKVWQLKRLQLISLSKFEQPKAYVLDHLPRMDQLSSGSVETRSLTPFETEALKKIESGAITVDELDGEKFNAVGAIVAVESCIECHSVQRGTLLGAFSYEFKPRTENE